VNAEIARDKLNKAITESSVVESAKPLKQNKRNFRSSIEDLFGRGKRLPVFSFITIDSDPNRKHSNNTNKNKK
jgi:hypothetical protein